jgi:hypothetical protein
VGKDFQKKLKTTQLAATASPMKTVPPRKWFTMKRRRNPDAIAPEAVTPPTFHSWGQKEVAEFIADDCGLPQYRRVFLNNIHSGKKLSEVVASSLCAMGVHALAHQCIILNTIRELTAEGASSTRHTSPNKQPASLFKATAHYSWRQDLAGALNEHRNKDDEDTLERKKRGAGTMIVRGKEEGAKMTEVSPGIFVKEVIIKGAISQQRGPGLEERTKRPSEALAATSSLLMNQNAMGALRRQRTLTKLKQSQRATLPPLSEGPAHLELGNREKFLCANSVNQMGTCYVPISREAPRYDPMDGEGF